MKKVISILTAAALLTATCILFAGCGEEKKDTKETAAPTQAATQAVTEAPTAVPATQAPATLAPVEQPTEPQEQTEAPTEYEGAELYGGITANFAASSALDCAGSGYEVVSVEQRYLRNQEAWYIGVKALTTDSTIYYIYVNENGAYPVSEIPYRGSGQEGVCGGITLDTAVEYAKNYLGEGYDVTGSEPTRFTGVEAWWIMAEATDGSDSRVLYVNSDGVIGEAV